MARITIESLFNAPSKPSRKGSGDGLVIDGESTRIEPAVNRNSEVAPAPTPYTMEKPDVFDASSLILNQPKQRIPFGPLRKIIPRDIQNRRDLLEQLNGTLPLNDSSLPEHIFRADMLDYTQFQKLSDPDLPTEDIAKLQESLGAATIRLKYHEGYPSLPNGMPLWTQLEYEPREAHEAFLSYQQLGGARMLETLSDQYPMENLLEWFHVYVWSFRLTAFDMFKIVRQQKLRLIRALNVEDDHFAMLERIMKSMKQYFEDPEKFDLEKLAPEKAVAMLSSLMKLQRLSAGMSERGGDNEVMPAKVAPVEILMRQMAAPQVAKETEETEEFDVLAESPDNIELAQELIIRLNQPKPSGG